MLDSLILLLQVCRDVLLGCIYIYIYHIPLFTVAMCLINLQFSLLQGCTNIQEVNKMLEPYVSFVDEDALYSVYLIVVDKHGVDDVLTLVSLLL